MANADDTPAVSDIPPEDRTPFVKALALLAAADDSVTIDEKQAVKSFADAWDLGDDAQQDMRALLRQGTTDETVEEVAGAFTNTKTRYLLIQELVRLSHLDASYGEEERALVRQVAEKLHMSDERIEEIEDWIERGLAWSQDSAFDDASSLDDALGDLPGND
jgi:uncharacterized tellurite resistance protein B-like protein